MSMKKLLALALSLSMVLSLTACGSGESQTETADPEVSSDASADAVVATVDESADPVTTVNNFADQAQTYLEYIGTNLTNRNSNEDGTDHDTARDWILSELENAGYSEDQISCQEEEDSDGHSVQNIVLTVDGQDSSKQIIVGAHYDGDGTGDNGSGIALLLATAVGLEDQQPLYTVKYIFFDTEEINCCGSTLYADQMTDEEVASTLYMINIDSIGFGDYCNVYGGVQTESGDVIQTEGYELAMAKATALGLSTMGTEDLDGYYAEHGQGPDIEPNTLYTNPWTLDNPAPANGDYISPSTGDWGDHAEFTVRGITYIYLEATDWYAAGDGGYDAYTGYFDTSRSELAEYGMFMNTEYDTLENLNTYFPGRTLNHFNVFSPLLSSLVLNPDSEAATAE